MSCCLRRERNRRTTPFFRHRSMCMKNRKTFAILSQQMYCTNAGALQINNFPNNNSGGRLPRLQTPPRNGEDGSWSDKNLNDDKAPHYRPMCMKFSAPSLLLFYLKPMYPWRGPKFGTFPTAAVHVKCKAKQKEPQWKEVGRQKKFPTDAVAYLQNRVKTVYCTNFIDKKRSNHVKVVYWIGRASFNSVHAL